MSIPMEQSSIEWRCPIESFTNFHNGRIFTWYYPSFEKYMLTQNLQWIQLFLFSYGIFIQINSHCWETNMEYMIVLRSRCVGSQSILFSILFAAWNSLSLHSNVDHRPIDKASLGICGWSHVKNKIVFFWNHLIEVVHKNSGVFFRIVSSFSLKFALGLWGQTKKQ